MKPKRIKKEWDLNRDGKEIKLVKTIGNKYYLSTFVLLSKLEVQKLMEENGLK